MLSDSGPAARDRRADPRQLNITGRSTLMSESVAGWCVQCVVRLFSGGAPQARSFNGHFGDTPGLARIAQAAFFGRHHRRSLENSLRQRGLLPRSNAFVGSRRLDIALAWIRGKPSAWRDTWNGCANGQSKGTGKTRHGATFLPTIRPPASTREPGPAVSRRSRRSSPWRRITPTPAADVVAATSACRDAHPR